MERGFLSQKGDGGGRGVKEKQHGSANVNVVSSAIDEPCTTAPIGTIVPTNFGYVDGDPAKRTNVINNDESFPVLNMPGNSSGGSHEVVKNGMDSGFVDPKVVEGVDEPVSTTPKYFKSLVTNEAVTCKRVAFPVVGNYVKNAWKKFGLVLVMMNSNGFFFFKFASIEGMNGVLENGPWFILKFHDIPMVAFTVDGLSVMAIKLGLIMVIAIPNVKDDGEVLHMHDDMLCPKWHVEKPKKQHTNHDGFQYTSSSHGINVDSKVQFKPKKPIWQVVSKKNNVISSGDEFGSNRGSSNSGKKVVQDVAGSASGSPSNTPLVARINELESQMIEGTLVLLDDDEKPLKPSTLTLPNSSNVISKKVDDVVNEDNDIEVKDVYDEIATYMASTGFSINNASKSGSGGGSKSLYEQWKENHDQNPYDDDDFDDPSLIHAQMKLTNTFYSNLCDKLR
ncbi:reverse transcriptase domain-containing protein [Tanacetum coccineum]